MAKVSKWPKRRFAGQVLPSPSNVGLAIEALSYGLDDLTCHPIEHKLVAAALGRVLAYAAQHRDVINDADYALFQEFGRRYINHPLVKNAGWTAP